MTAHQLAHLTCAELKARHGLTTLRTKGLSIRGVAFSTAVVSDGERWADGYGSDAGRAVRNAIGALDALRSAAA